MSEKLYDTDKHTMITRTVTFFLSGLTGCLAYHLFIGLGLTNTHNFPYEYHVWKAIWILSAIAFPFCLLIAIVGFIASKKHLPAFFASGFSLLCGLVFAYIIFIPIDYLCAMNLMNKFFGL